ncbi:MAG TPA: prolyl-tRNA synthetase associated domain-containing protein [Xanthobacteraceae bacterium]|jgi:Ala-tRNA(Pro) deacylase
MAAKPEDLFAFLDRLGIGHRTVTHPPLFTVEQSRELRGQLPGAHTKNLFLIDRKDRLFLVVAEESAEIDLKHLHRRIGASGRLSFGKPEVLRSVLGVEPGSVTPFATINDTERRVAVLIDATLAAQSELNCHPLTNTRTTRLAMADLMRFLRETGHEPRILPISGPEAPVG